MGQDAVKEKNWQAWKYLMVKDNEHGQSGLYAMIDIPYKTVIGAFGGKIECVSPIPERITNSIIQIAINREQDILLILTGEKDFRWEGISYMNHSCEPNANMVAQTIIVANRDIKRGEEITVDYNSWNFIGEGVPCWCPKCDGKVTI
jgi:SET domain-containing protein